MTSDESNKILSILIPKYFKDLIETTRSVTGKKNATDNEILNFSVGYISSIIGNLSSMVKNDPQVQTTLYNCAISALIKVAKMDGIEIKNLPDMKFELNEKIGLNDEH